MDKVLSPGKCPFSTAQQSIQTPVGRELRGSMVGGREEVIWVGKVGRGQTESVSGRERWDSRSSTPQDSVSMQGFSP